MLLSAGLAASSVAGEALVWQRIAKGSVEILTTADPQLARAALAELDALRASLFSAAPWLAEAEGPLCVLLFDSESAARDLLLNPFSPAYYVPNPDQGAIVLFGAGEHSLSALRHEFIHHQLRVGGRRLPLWLEEGLADALSVLPQPERERRLRMLRAGRRIAWADVLEARPGASVLRDWDSARLFYAQSWALTEALIGSDETAVRPGDLDTWQAAGQLPAPALEALLQRFLNRPDPAGHRQRLQRRPAEFRTEIAPAHRVSTVLGRLSLQLRRFEGAGPGLLSAAMFGPELSPTLP